MSASLENSMRPPLGPMSTRVTPQGAEVQTQFGEAKQREGVRRQQPEAVYGLGADVVQLLAAVAGADTFVHDQPQMHIGQVVFREQRRRVQVDLQ